MTPEDMRRRVERCAAALSLDLFEGVTTGVASARAMLRSLPNRDEYPHLLPLTARAFMREHWLMNGLPGQWTVSGNSRLMGQTILSSIDENMEMRLLKERRRTYPGGVPVAGSNSTRRDAWRQFPLDIEIPNQPVSGDTVRLLALWDIAEEGDHLVVSVRVVHTLQPGVFGSRVPIDLSYEIKPTGGIFDLLQFRGDAQDEDFFAEIDREENEGDAAGQ